VGVDSKRLHTFKQLLHAEDGWVSATSENMSLHVDMTTRKVAPFPPDIAETLRATAKAHSTVPRDPAIGRRIVMPS
jgi:acyl-CoA thioester hydrolase